MPVGGVKPLAWRVEGGGYMCRSIKYVFIWVADGDTADSPALIGDQKDCFWWNCRVGVGAKGGGWMEDVRYSICTKDYSFVLEPPGG